MDNWIWNLEGTKVQHVLSGWTGIVIRGKQVGMMDAGDNFPIASVRFLVWTTGNLLDGDNRCSFVELDCVKAELENPQK